MYDSSTSSHSLNFCIGGFSLKEFAEEFMLNRINKL